MPDVFLDIYPVEYSEDPTSVRRSLKVPVVIQIDGEYIKDNIIIEASDIAWLLETDEKEGN